MELALPDYTIRYETWHCDDVRLPESKDVYAVKPDTTFLQSLNEIQLQPIGVIETKAGCFLGYGRRRLLAVRSLNAGELLAEDGTIINHKRNGEIDVMIISIDEIDSIAEALSLIENHHRSPNPISDYMAIATMLKNKMDYKAIAKRLGVDTNTVRALDQHWSRVPAWTLEAVLDGKVAPSTAEAIGKVGPEAQKRLKKVLSKEKKITAKMVKEERQAIQQETMSQMAPLMQFDEPRDFFSRDEVLQIRQIALEHNCEPVLAFIDGLLA